MTLGFSPKDLVDLEEHVIQADEDLGRDQDDDGPLQGVALLVLHELQEVLQVLLHQLQLVLDRVEPRLQKKWTRNPRLNPVRPCVVISWLQTVGP